MSRFPSLMGLLLFASVLLSACGAGGTPTPQFVDGIRDVQPAIQMKDFTLEASTGKPISFADLRGKYALVAFGYTHCPDVCPITLANFKLVHKKLAALGDKVNFVFISVDGARDTPQVLADHLKYFDTSVIGLTGTDDQLKAVTPQFGVVYKLEKKTPDQTEYAVTHTASSFLIDDQGRLVRVYEYGLRAEAIVADIQGLLGVEG